MVSSTNKRKIDDGEQGEHASKHFQSADARQTFADSERNERKPHVSMALSRQSDEQVKTFSLKIKSILIEMINLLEKMTAQDDDAEYSFLDAQPLPSDNTTQILSLSNSICYELNDIISSYHIKTLPWSYISHQAQLRLHAVTGNCDFLSNYVSLSLTAQSAVIVISTILNIFTDLLPISASTKPLDASAANSSTDVYDVNNEYAWHSISPYSYLIDLLPNSAATSMKLLGSMGAERPERPPGPSTVVSTTRPAAFQPLRTMDSRISLLHERPFLNPSFRCDIDADRLCHWGPRKLLLMEIDFLCTHSNTQDTVLYIGAAPGHHIDYLANTLFPDLHFFLYDPAPFNKQLSELPNVSLFNEFFTMEEALQFKQFNKNLLFISDIRRLQSDEDGLNEDMIKQSVWHKTIIPKASLLKFRLPEEEKDRGPTSTGTDQVPSKCDSKCLYLAGDLYMQPYASRWSHEGRLVCIRPEPVEGGEDFTPTPDTIWDPLIYCKRFDYFNAFIRPVRCEHECRGAGLSDTWDAHVELEILASYLRSASSNMRYPFNRVCEMNKFGPDVACDDPDAGWRLIKFSREISFVLGWRDDWKSRANAAALEAKEKLIQQQREQWELSQSMLVASSPPHYPDCFSDDNPSYDDDDDTPEDGCIVMSFNIPTFLASDTGTGEFTVHYNVHGNRVTVRCSLYSFKILNGVLSEDLLIDYRTSTGECMRHIEESLRSRRRIVSPIKLVVDRHDSRSVISYGTMCRAMEEKGRVGLCSVGEDVKVYIGKSGYRRVPSSHSPSLPTHLLS